MSAARYATLRSLLIHRGGEAIGGGEIRVRCLDPAHDDASPSACWNESKGCWHCLACGAKGTTADLTRLLNADLALASDSAPPARPRMLVEGRETRTSAQLVWKETGTAHGTIVETYLASREITIPVPAALRFQPCLWHSESRRGVPAMVAGIQGPAGKLVAVHRTWLRPDGAGKADLVRAKKLLGPVDGGAVRLGSPTHDLMVGEGIETVLSAMQLFDRPGWAATSSAHMRKLILPYEVSTVTVLVDGDAAGVKAAQHAASRWRSEGRRVDFKRAPDGMDWNDVLRARADRGH